MNSEFETIIEAWLNCEITGDHAMAKIVKIFDKGRSDTNEIINACVEEKS